MEFLTGMFSSGSFMPHGYCYLWDRGLVWLHLVSDVLIAVAYFSIPITLLYFVRKRHDLPFHWMFVCFGVFIIACGTTHVMEVWTLWHANYWLSGMVKAVTALASVPTAILLAQLVPKAITLPSPDQLARNNGELAVANAALRQSEQRSRLLFDSNPHPLWVYDTKTLAFLDVNHSATQNYGYSRQEFLSLTIKDIRPSEDVSELLESVTKASSGTETAGTWRHRKKDGTLIDAEITSHPLTFSGKAARLVVATDITEQKRSENRLKESEERFRLIVSNIKDYAIIGLDPEGRVTSWNGGAQKIKGYREEEILTKHLSVFYLPEDIAIGKPTIELDSAREHGRFEDDGWRVRKDGSRFWANVVVTPVRDDEGSLRGFVKITRDVTERRKIEQEIVRRSVELEAANKELEAFSYSVSHDLRAPLRGIEGFSQALQEDYEQKFDDTAKDYLGRIRSATLRMGELIDDLLNLSRVTRAEMYREPINLSKLANEVGQELQSREPARKVALKIAPGLEAVGDLRLVRVVLQNLIGNAWKFTSRRAEAEIEFGVSRSNGDQAYFVRDNGAGFDQTYASRLFGPFQRLHATNEFPGTGIGLATVQRIIHRHGGAVWAEGFVDRGATVYFTLGRGNSGPGGPDGRQGDSARGRQC
jgi:PAS domain S-box-containing protein